MDCKNCEFCDGPIAGLPCSKYEECYEAEMQRRMNNIDNNIGVCMLVIEKNKEFIQQPIKRSFEEEFKLANPDFIDGQADPYNAI